MQRTAPSNKGLLRAVWRKDAGEPLRAEISIDPSDRIRVHARQTRSDFQTAMKGDRLRPLRSARAVAVHQDGIGGRGHPVAVFFPDQAKLGAVRRRHGLRPRRSGPRRFDARRRAVRKLRGRTDPSASIRRHTMGDNQIDRVCVLEVRIQSPPAESRANFCTGTRRSRDRPKAEAAFRAGAGLV